jgi:hypothetical protein
MDPYEYHELHDRWDGLMVRMIRLFSKLDIRVEEQDCSLEDRKEIVKLIYHHGWVETNLKKNEPQRCTLYEYDREHLDSIEADVIDHEQTCSRYV